MAKKKEQPSESEVTMKNPDQVLNFDRIGMVITKDNLTLERYNKLISISPSFSQYFNLKTKTNEVETKE
jgi:hypothetical protein